MDNQNYDLSEIIRAMRSPMESAGSIYSSTTENCKSYPPSYNTVQDTVAKELISMGDSREVHSTEMKRARTPYDSDDSDTDIKNIRDETDLLRQIENLRREQEDLRQKQNIHEQHIKDLLDREPCVHKHFKTMRRSLISGNRTENFGEWEDLSLMSPTQKPQHTTTTEEHIFVQIEQLYANFHILHFPSSTAKNILGGLNSNNNSRDAVSLNEVQSLRKKVQQLEEEKQRAITERPAPVPHLDGKRLLNAKLPTPPNNFVTPGRPSSPLPLLPKHRDICPVESAFEWTISDYSKKFQQEKYNEGQKQTSCPFYLTHNGYRAQIEAYLNGNSTATNRFMSVFLRVIKGDCDRQLKWPVKLRLAVTLVNQSGDNTLSLKSDEKSFTYTQPTGVASNDNSECWGFIDFASHDVIKKRQYISNDKIVLKCRVFLV